MMRKEEESTDEKLERPEFLKRDKFSEEYQKYAEDIENKSQDIINQINEYLNSNK